jgi:hypothetical protein
METIDVTLEPGDLYAIADRRAQSVRIEFGNVWLTRAADCEDHLLADGESISLDRDGLTLVKAYRPTRLSIALRS